jgi:hypothetical protein
MGDDVQEQEGLGAAPHGGSNVMRVDGRADTEAQALALISHWNQSDPHGGCQMIPGSPMRSSAAIAYINANPSLPLVWVNSGLGGGDYVWLFTCSQAPRPAPHGRGLPIGPTKGHPSLGAPFNHATSLPRSYLHERSWVTDAGAFSHAGGGSALFPGQLRWVVVDANQVPSEQLASLRAQAQGAQAGSWFQATNGARYYGLGISNGGPVLYTWALGDPQPAGMGARTRTSGVNLLRRYGPDTSVLERRIAERSGFRRGYAAPPPVNQQFQQPPGVDPTQAQADVIATGKDLGGYIIAKGCDGTPAFTNRVKAFQTAVNETIDAINAQFQTQMPHIPVDGTLTPALAAKLQEAGQKAGLTIPACGAAPPAPPAPPSPPAPPASIATTGMSTGEMVAIGAGALAAVGAVVYFATKKGRR